MPLDPDSWARVPVSLAGVPVVPDVSGETFTPGYSIALPENVDWDTFDGAAYGLLIDIDNEDSFASTRTFTAPIAPFLESLSRQLRSKHILKVKVYPYRAGNIATETVELKGTAVCTSQGSRGEAFASTVYATATAEATDAVISPPDLRLALSNALPVEGSDPVADHSSLTGYEVALDMFLNPGAMDESMVPINLFGWLTFNGTSYSSADVSTNNFISFPVGAANTYSPSRTQPPRDKLLICGQDNESKLIAVQYGLNYVRVRHESFSYNLTPQDPQICWEVTFFTPEPSLDSQLIEVRIGRLEDRTYYNVNKYLKAATASAWLAQSSVVADTSYVMVGNASGTRWTIHPQCHVQNPAGVYGTHLSAHVQTGLTVSSGGTSLLAETVSGLELNEPPTSYIQSLETSGDGTTVTVQLPGLYPAMVWSRYGGAVTDHWLGAPALNASGGGSSETTGLAGEPKAFRTSDAFTLAGTQSTSYLAFGFGSVQVGSLLNPVAAGQVFRWAFGSYGAPRRNRHGLAAGGVESLTSASGSGFSFYTYRGVSPTDVPAGGLAVGHGLKDADGNPIAPELVFSHKHFASGVVTTPIHVAGSVLPAVDVGGGQTAAGYLLLAGDNGSQNLALAPLAAMAESGPTAFYADPVADERCVYLGEASSDSSSLWCGFAFATVPGRCKVGLVTSIGQQYQLIETGFQPRFALLKSLSGSSHWCLYGDQAGLSMTGLAADAKASLTTLANAAGGAVMGPASVAWFNPANDAGSAWVYVVVGGDEGVVGLLARGGAISSSGTSATMTRQLRLAAAKGTGTLTLRRAVWSGLGLQLDGEPGAYALTGQAAGLRRALYLSAAGGSMSVTGRAADLTAVTYRYFREWALQTYDGGSALALPEWWAD